MLLAPDLPGSYAEPILDLPSCSPNLVGDLGQPISTLGTWHRCLVALTSSRFRAAKEVAFQFQGLFTSYEQAGWSLRASPPRYFICWRNSWLARGSNLRIAFFPDRQFGLSCQQKAALCLSELLRREARLKLIARGFPPKLADEPAAILYLREAVCRHLFGEDRCREPAVRFFADLERRIEGALFGRSVSTHRGCQCCDGRCGG
jgi:hypothetical protein